MDQLLIHNRGFDMLRGAPTETLYDKQGRIKVGMKVLDDAVLTFGNYSRRRGFRYTKEEVLDALMSRNVPKLRDISNYFYLVSGIYQRACDYFANLYRYDWYVVPEIYDDRELNEEKIIKAFVKSLNYLDNTHIKKICGDITLKVILNGAYYGYFIDNGTSGQLQELPASYCRSRYSVNGVAAVEFNMKFFDVQFPDTVQRLRVLKMFPSEFQKGYALYKKGKLVSETALDRDFGWYLLDPAKTVKFNLNNLDLPIFISAIPAILDLDEAEDLDRKKQMQKLLKILIQKLPLDKNGDLIFDVEEAKDIHNNAVNMLKRAIGVDVVTTFADVDAIDLSDKNTSTTSDDIAKVERTVYNAMGLSKNIFNTDGNLSLEKSILEDESTLRNFLLQLEIFFDRIIVEKNTTKKNKFRFYMLETTQYNYKDLSVKYKEQVQIGYSKMLPQIALGHSQSSIINTAYFENKILHLSTVMIPPLMSSTLSSADILGENDSSDTSKNDKSTEKLEIIQTEENKGGRPEKPDDQKSEKTIQNQESMS